VRRERREGKYNIQHQQIAENSN